jgi:hypothetical protein
MSFGQTSIASNFPLAAGTLPILIASARFLRENPVPTILGALGLGIAIGLAIRYVAPSERKTEIEVKSPWGNLNWSVLSLPFLWPMFKSAKKKYERSADAVADAMKDGVKRLKKMDVERYAKPIRKRWRAWAR